MLRKSFQLMASFVVLQIGLSVPTWAGSHSWRINEIFSNASGTIQFIELKECCGLSDETHLVAEQVTSNSNFFQFPDNIVGPTSHKTLLFATDGFAELPGAPTRDYAIPSNFFNVNGDTIRYNPDGNYDTFTFGPGELPVNGVDSIQITDFVKHSFVTDPNTPTNYGGESGTVAGNIPTVSEWGALTIALALLSAGSLLIRNRTG